jgi:hypothetical protein
MQRQSQDVGHRQQKDGVVLPEVAGRIAIDFENSPNVSVYSDWHVQERGDAMFSQHRRYPQVRFTDEIVNDQRLTRLERLPWHGAWISSERSVPHDTRAPTQTCYDEEISQGRTMLQNLRMLDANATGSLHNGKLQ